MVGAGVGAVASIGGNFRCQLRGDVFLVIITRMNKSRWKWWLRWQLRSLVPYPLRAARLEVAFHPFTVLGGTWFDWDPGFRHTSHL